MIARKLPTCFNMDPQIILKGSEKILSLPCIRNHDQYFSRILMIIIFSLRISLMHIYTNRIILLLLLSHPLCSFQQVGVFDLTISRPVIGQLLPNRHSNLKLFKPVYEQIFILVRIEYQILFASAKLSESNSKYYSCCKIYSNNIRIVQNIRIFEYFRIICNAKMKNFPK